MTPVQNILHARARLGEGPIWDEVSSRLYWVDIYNHRVHWLDPATQETQFYDVGQTVGAIAPTTAGRLIMARRHQLAFLDPQTGRIDPIRDVEADRPHNRFNDGKCDTSGRFWFGSMCNSGPHGSLYRYDPDGTLHTMETGLTISNGLGWSPDQRRFYLADSPLQKIYVYDYDAASGAIANRRVHVDLTAESCYPDGLTVDAEGCLWVALWDGWRVQRFDPEGQPMGKVPMPVQRPTSCNFGGPDLQTLYITSASVGLSEAEIEQSFFSGDLFALEPGVRGLPLTPFRDKL
ncbi:MAG: SMP-30/gluconolactonase/LRE family protein [Elainellaceae cyanobacterium]